MHVRSVSVAVLQLVALGMAPSGCGSADAEPTPPGTTAACGDGVVQMGEVCDGSELAEITCSALPGFASGALRCQPDCRGYDVSGCTAGAVRQAADCQLATVQAAVDAASPGDTVQIPAGSCTWTSSLSIEKSLTLAGAGVDATILTTVDTAAIGVDVSNGAARLTGFALQGTLPLYGSAVYLDGIDMSFRVDHLRILDLSMTGDSGLRGFMVGTGNVAHGRTGTPPRGVFDHVEFHCSDNAQFVLVYGENESWLQPDKLGTRDFVFFEDNTVELLPGATVTDGEHGARLVVRHNDVLDGWVAWHDTGSTPQSRSTRAVEMYGNTFHCDQQDCGWVIVALRGGTGVVYDNVTPIFPNGYEQASASEIFRVYPGSAGAPWTADCDGTVDRICSSFQSHCDAGDHHSCYDTTASSDCAGMGSCVNECTGDAECPAGSTCLEKLDGHQAPNGWPCRDQTGRGMDDPVTHSQASAPMYWWNNRSTSAELLPLQVHDADADYIQAERDFFSQVEAFDGTQGVGAGPLSSRPATCTPGTGYWAEDAGELWTCAEANSWAIHYRPYPYPHPFTALGP